MRRYQLYGNSYKPQNRGHGPTLRFQTVCSGLQKVWHLCIFSRNEPNLRAKFPRINIADRPETYSDLVLEFPNSRYPHYFIQKDGFAVSRRSDFIVYSVEAANIHHVVKLYGPATKCGAIVAGQVEFFLLTDC